MRPRYSVGTKSLARPGTGSKVSPRDLYNRRGSSARPNKSDRPITSSRVVDRYRGRLGTGADRKTPTRRSADRPANKSATPVAPRSGSDVRSGPRLRGANPGGSKTIRDTAGHRYPRAGKREPAGRPGTGPRSPRLGAGNRSGGGTLQPSLRRPTAVAPLAVGRAAPRVSAPRLHPRRSAVGHGGYGVGYRAGHYLGGHYGYYGHSSLFFGISFGLGYGYYSYPYFYGAYWPYHYYRHCYSYGLYGYYRPYCYPSYFRHYSYWWWPSYCYLPSYRYVSYYPSTVIIADEVYTDDYDDEGGEEVVVVGSRPSSSGESMAELAEKYVSLGDFYFKEGRFQEAADAYARARTYAPNDASIHFVLADALFAIGDYHFAAYLINEAIRLDPDIARADTDKRLFYSDVKVFEEQMQTLLKYLEDKPYDAMAHLVLGYNLKFSGKSGEAKLAFQKVLEIEPGNRSAIAFLMAIDKPDEPIVLPPIEAPASRPAGSGEKAPGKGEVKKD